MANPESVFFSGVEKRSVRLKGGGTIPIPFRPGAAGEVRAISIALSADDPEKPTGKFDPHETFDTFKIPTVGGIKIRLTDSNGTKVGELTTTDEDIANGDFGGGLRHTIGKDDAKGEWKCTFHNLNSRDMQCDFFLTFPRSAATLVTTKIPLPLLGRSLSQFLEALAPKVELNEDRSFVEFGPELREFSGGKLDRTLFSTKVSGLSLTESAVGIVERAGKPVLIVKAFLRGDGRIHIKGKNPKIDGVDLTVAFELRAAGMTETRNIVPKVSVEAKALGVDTLIDAFVDEVKIAEGIAEEKVRSILENPEVLAVLGKYLTAGFIGLAKRSHVFYDIAASSEDVLVKHYTRKAVIIDDATGGVSGGVSGGAGDGGNSEGGVSSGSRSDAQDEVVNTEGRENLDKIDHIVVLMLENRSFDTMLGYLSLPEEKGGQGRADVEGLGGTESNSTPASGQPVRSKELRETVFKFDPSHRFGAVRKQIANGSMAGFVESFRDRYPEEDFDPSVMGFHTASHLKMYNFLAEEFLICNRWFASHPGPTQPNRFCLMSGMAPERDNFRFDDPRIGYVDLPTVFGLLSSFDISWAFYEHDIASLRFYDRFRLDNRNVLPILGGEDGKGGPDGFFARAREGKLPKVTFIDPSFVDVPIGGPPNDDHPPSDVTRGQKLVEDIYRALATSPLWPKMLFVITYDEHGGFFDHVPPPGTPLFKAKFPTAKFDVDPVIFQDSGNTPVPDTARSTGVRVPAFVVSPFVPKHNPPKVQGTTDIIFDHTSIIKTIMLKFGADQQLARMNARVRNANNLGMVLTLSKEESRVDAPSPPAFAMVSPPPVKVAAEAAVPEPDDFHLALRRFGVPTKPVT